MYEVSAQTVTMTIKLMSMTICFDNFIFIFFTRHTRMRKNLFSNYTFPNAMIKKKAKCYFEFTY